MTCKREEDETNDTQTTTTTRDQMFPNVFRDKMNFFLFRCWIFFSEMYKTTRYDGSTSTDVCERIRVRRRREVTGGDGDGKRRSVSPLFTSRRRRCCWVEGEERERERDFEKVKAASAPKYPPPDDVPAANKEEHIYK